MKPRKKGKAPKEPEFEVLSEAILEEAAKPPVVYATPQEVEVLTALSSGKAPKQALQAAGLDVDTPVAEAYCGGLQRRYNEALQDALQRKGVTVDRIAGVVAAQMEARKFVAVRGLTETTLHAVPDNTAIQGAVNIALDILPGARAPKRMEVETRSLESILLRIQHDDDD